MQLPVLRILFVITFAMLVVSSSVKAEHEGKVQILLLGDSTTEGSVPRRHVPEGPHLEDVIRLLLAGIQILREGFVPIRVSAFRDELLAIRRGEMPWEESEAWRLRLHKEFDLALKETNLPELPDYERANDFLVRARRSAVEI